MKSDPWQRYTTPPPNIFFLDRYNKKGRKCPSHAHIDSDDHLERISRAKLEIVATIKHFFVWEGGGYNAAKGLISQKITKKTSFLFALILAKTQTFYLPLQPFKSFFFQFQLESFFLFLMVYCT